MKTLTKHHYHVSFICFFPCLLLWSGCGGFGWAWCPSRGWGSLILTPLTVTTRGLKTVITVWISWDKKRTKLNANNLYLLGLNPNHFFIVSFCLIHCIMFQSTATQYGHIRMLPFFMGLLPNIADVMTSQMCFEYNYPSKQLRLTCMDGWIRPFMLSFTLLTSNQVVRQ